MVRFGVAAGVELEDATEASADRAGSWIEEAWCWSWREREPMVDVDEGREIS